MPKRKSDETKQDRWLRKMKKYEDKLTTDRRSRRIIYSSDEDVSLNEDTNQARLENDFQRSNEVPDGDSFIEPNNGGQIEENFLSTPIIPTEVIIPSEDIQQPDIDTELLQTLGDFQPDTVEWGDDLLEEIGKRFQHILLNGLKKETKDELHKRYLFPKNVPLSKAPILNPELSSILSDTYKNRDKIIKNKQDQLGKALSALGKAMSSLMVRNPNIQGVMRNLNDCSQLIADSHYAETYTRRSLVIPLVDKPLIDPMKDRKRDELLFGENLGEMVKSSRGIKRTGNLMQATTSNLPLNWKGPPSRARPARNYTRGGGQRTQFTRGRRYPQSSTQRRAGFTQPPPAPPPPPPRRQTAQTSSSSRRPPAQSDRSMHL